MNNAQNNNAMSNATTTAQDILKQAHQRRIAEHRQHLMDLEGKQNKTRVDEIDIAATKNVLRWLEGVPV